MAAPDEAAGEGASPTSRRSAKSPDPDRDMGSALRSIYQRTVEEQVPDEMLSLLSLLSKLD